MNWNENMTESPGEKLVLKVDGMTCSHCVGRVQKALDAAPGVVEAKVDLDTGTAEIRLGADADPSVLVAAVEAAGYSAAAA